MTNIIASSHYHYHYRPPEEGGGAAVKKENYPEEVNEVSQVDEGKIAAKRGQRFLFSLFPPRRRGKNGLSQDGALLEDGGLHAPRRRNGRDRKGRGRGGEINGVKWLHLARR